MHGSLTNVAVVVLAVLAMFALGLAACNGTPPVPTPDPLELTPNPPGASPGIVSPEAGGQTIGVEATAMAPTPEPTPASTEPPGGEPDCGCDMLPAWPPEVGGDAIGGVVRLDGAPIAQVCVRIYDGAVNRMGETVTDGAGQYEFSDLPAGTWLVAPARKCGPVTNAIPVEPMFRQVDTVLGATSTFHTADFDFE